MINKKLLLGLAVISIVYTGCNEEKQAPITTVVDEKKVKPAMANVKTNSTKNSDIIVKTEAIITKVQKKSSAPSAKVLYKKCTGCHGLNGEKKALNKSAVIKDWNAQKIADALQGYKKGTYGGAMKGVMKGQVVGINDKEIDLLSKYISDFK